MKLSLTKREVLEGIVVIDSLKRVYYVHVMELNDNNLVHIAYSDEISRDKEFSHKIKLFLQKINFSHVWANQSTVSKAKLLHAVTAKLKDSYKGC